MYNLKKNKKSLKKCLTYIFNKWYIISAFKEEELKFKSKNVDLNQVKKEFKKN